MKKGLITFINLVLLSYILLIIVNISKTYSIVIKLSDERLSINKCIKLGVDQTNFYLNTFFSTKTSQLNLEVATDDLFKSIPFSSKEYKEGAFDDENGEKYEAKIKLRGDNFYHWAFSKKSWRLKTKKKKLYKRNRKFNLIIPKTSQILNNHCCYKFAKIMGLLAPESELLNISINGSYEGLKIYTEQIGECFLRKNKRMPLSIYRGDLVGSKNLYGVGHELFNYDFLWYKVSDNNYMNSNLDLREILKDINSNNIDHINTESYSKFVAYTWLFNIYHIDGIHNQYIYYDSFKSKAEPIVWDPVGLINKSNFITYFSTSNLVDKLLLDDKFYLETLGNIDKYLSITSTFTDTLNSIVSKAHSRIEESNYHIDMKGDFYTKKDMHDNVNNFEDEVEGVLKGKLVDFHKARIYDLKSIFDEKNNLKIKFKCNLPVSEIIFNNESISEKDSLLIFHDNKYKKSKLTKINDTSYSIKVSILPLRELSSNGKSNFKSLKFQTKEVLIFGLQDTTDVFCKFMFDTNTYWSPKEYIDKIELDNLKITNLDKKKSHENINTIAVYQKENYISKSIKFSDEKINLLVMGPKSNNSTFTNCTFENGLEDISTMYAYTGMVNVHDADSIVFKNCTFKNNLAGDDMVHVVYSSVIFDSCTFINSKMDALDCDISDVYIKNCTFINSGNDALDLMESRAIVENCKFIGSKDKGISVGENSVAQIKNCEFLSNKIGVESKDDSRAIISESHFEKNGLALNSYKKNWRYNDPGSVFEYNNKYTLNDTVKRFEDNSKHVLIDDEKELNKIISDF